MQNLQDYNKENKLEENKYIYNIHISLSSIDIEKPPKKTEIKDDDDENPHINFPFIFEIKNSYLN